MHAWRVLVQCRLPVPPSAHNHSRKDAQSYQSSYTQNSNDEKLYMGPHCSERLTSSGTSSCAKGNTYLIMGCCPGCPCFLECTNAIATSLLWPRRSSQHIMLITTIKDYFWCKTENWSHAWEKQWVSTGDIMARWKIGFYVEVRFSFLSSPQGSSGYWAFPIAVNLGCWCHRVSAA